MSRLDRYEYTAASMGTVLRIAVYAQSQPQAQQGIDAGLSEIERLIPILNNYDSDSEVSRLTRTVREPVRLSPDLAAVLRHAMRWHTLSGGAFDVTVGPLTQIWSRARREGVLPTAQAIRDAQGRSGWHHVRWIPGADGANEGGSVELLSDAMRIDVSGIATGYIIDQAFGAIRGHGIESLLIDVGGDIRVGQSPPESSGWRIDIAGLGRGSPLVSQRRLEDCAITTSGDLNQYVEIDGIRYSHLIDPRTGQSVSRRQSATAIADTAMDADAGATALCVLGMERAAVLFDDLPLREGMMLETGMEAPASQPLRYRRMIRDFEAP